MKLKERNMPYERHEKGRERNKGRTQTGFPQKPRGYGRAEAAGPVEREIRHERIRAEAAHIAEQHQLKKDVEAEAKEFKDLIGQK